ncbi:transmembrane protein, putative [Medicago truncatula]|uniref:Transmembrane protein, putative n=1 Tax=Medicago truncatula TaxID=3880 RepID=G7JJI3_MEDTR|nr:transmembrane protein, putative [Medicago truncatula]
MRRTMRSSSAPPLHPLLLMDALSRALSTFLHHHSYVKGEVVALSSYQRQPHDLGVFIVAMFQILILIDLVVLVRC